MGRMKEDQMAGVLAFYRMETIKYLIMNPGIVLLRTRNNNPEDNADQQGHPLGFKRRLSPHWNMIASAQLPHMGLPRATWGIPPSPGKLQGQDHPQRPTVGLQDGASALVSGERPVFRLAWRPETSLRGLYSSLRSHGTRSQSLGLFGPYLFFLPISPFETKHMFTLTFPCSACQATLFLPQALRNRCPYCLIRPPSPGLGKDHNHFSILCSNISQDTSLMTLSKQNSQHFHHSQSPVLFLLFFKENIYFIPPSTLSMKTQEFQDFMFPILLLWSQRLEHGGYSTNTYFCWFIYLSSSCFLKKNCVGSF